MRIRSLGWKTLALVGISILSLSVSASAQNDVAAERRALEEIIARGPTQEHFAENTIFAGGRYNRPFMSFAELRAEEEKVGPVIDARRPNEKRESKLVRLDVSQAGDMAYEVRSNSASWDGPDGKPAGFDATQLRVWRKIDGQWRIVATVIHPFPRQ